MQDFKMLISLIKWKFTTVLLAFFSFLANGKEQQPVKSVNISLNFLVNTRIILFGLK